MEKTKKSYYQSLYEVACAVNSAIEQEAVLHCIVERMTEAMEAKGCSLMLLSPDRRQLLHTVDCGLSKGYLTKGPISTDKSVAPALEGKPVAIEDVTTDDRVQYPEQAKKEGIASILCAPMMLRGEIVGVIRVYTADRRQFDLNDMYFVGAIAHLGAIALENAKRYERLEGEYMEFRRRTF
jgi:GAF domain-containing protein